MKNYERMWQVVEKRKYLIFINMGNGFEIKLKAFKTENKRIFTGKIITEIMDKPENISTSDLIDMK